MKILLAGYKDSKQIIGASSFLVAKYLGDGFDVRWLNYGPYDGPLFVGEYVSLAISQDGVESWARDIRRYLESLDDRLIIFALDDYLLSGPMNMHGYRELCSKMGNGIACVRLCMSDFYKPHECEQTGFIIRLTSQAEYSVTTQYCIWDRAVLIDILDQVNTPWEFEIYGSQALNSSGHSVIGRLKATLPYGEHSALSSRWSGVNVGGLSSGDIQELIERGLLVRDRLRQG